MKVRLGLVVLSILAFSGAYGTDDKVDDHNANGRRIPFAGLVTGGWAGLGNSSYAFAPKTWFNKFVCLGPAWGKTPQQRTFNNLKWKSGLATIIALYKGGQWLVSSKKDDGSHHHSR